MPFLAPWSDQGRALGADQATAASRQSCGVLLITAALLARICAAVLCGFIVLQGLGEMWVLRGLRGGD